MIGEFASWWQEYDSFDFCSWGAYDLNQLKQDCRHHGLEMPLKVDHRNLKAEFSARLGLGRKFGMAGALSKLGLQIEGTHHRGIDDARNIARIFNHIETNDIEGSKVPGSRRNRKDRDRRNRD